MVHGGHPNAQQRPRDVQEHPQGHSGIKKSPKLHKNDTEKSSNNAKTACLKMPTAGGGGVSPVGVVDISYLISYLYRLILD